MGVQVKNDIKKLSKKIDHGASQWAEKVKLLEA
jgi:hypothetical protein